MTIKFKIEYFIDREITNPPEFYYVRVTRAKEGITDYWEQSNLVSGKDFVIIAEKGFPHNFIQSLHLTILESQHSTILYKLALGNSNISYLLLFTCDYFVREYFKRKIDLSWENNDSKKQAHS